jgi:hypothetical protein
MRRRALLLASRRVWKRAKMRLTRLEGPLGVFWRLLMRLRIPKVT